MENVLPLRASEGLQKVASNGEGGLQAKLKRKERRGEEAVLTFVALFTVSAESALLRLFPKKKRKGRELEEGCEGTLSASVDEELFERAGEAMSGEAEPEDEVACELSCLEAWNEYILLGGGRDIACLWGCTLAR
jgi:hypothetical protein